MKPTSPALPLGACVLAINDRGQVLVVNRPDRTDLVCLPGGKLEAGETFSQAACRELFEETGLRVATDQLLPVYRGECEGGTDGQAYDVALFLLMGVVGEIPGSTEPALKAWFDDPQALLTGSPFRGYNRLGLKAGADELDLALAWMTLSNHEREAMAQAKAALVGACLATKAVAA